MSFESMNTLVAVSSTLQRFDNDNSINQKLFCEVVNKNSEDIIKSFGGLCNMIQLCLSIPNIDHITTTNNEYNHELQHFKKIQINVFANIMKQNGIIPHLINNNNNNNNNVNQSISDTNINTTVKSAQIFKPQTPSSQLKTVTTITSTLPQSTANIDDQVMRSPNQVKLQHPTTASHVALVNYNYNVTSTSNSPRGDHDQDDGYIYNYNYKQESHITPPQKLESAYALQPSMSELGNYHSNAESRKTAHAHVQMQMQRQMMVVSSIIGYFTSNIIIGTKSNNNLCFKWFPLQYATRFDNIVSNKLYSVIMFITIVTFRILQEIFTVPSEEWPGVKSKLSIGFSLCSSLLFLFYSISIILICNLKIMYLIINTFDFWFKIWSIIAAYMSFAVIIIGSRTTIDTPIAMVLSMCSSAMFFISVFFVDALYIVYRVKIVMSIIAAAVVYYHAIGGYLFMNEYRWNPFTSFEHSEISFKSMFVASLFNLALFLLKQPISMVMRKLRRRFCGRTMHSPGTNTDHDSEHDEKNDFDSKYQRCGSVYKRPYLQWQ